MSPYRVAKFSLAPTTRIHGIRDITGDRSILMCLDEKTGELLWQLVIPKLASGKSMTGKALVLLSSSTVEGDRLMW
jgi:hypothetical protein